MLVELVKFVVVLLCQGVSGYVVIVLYCACVSLFVFCSLHIDQLCIDMWMFVIVLCCYGVVILRCYGC